MVCDSHLAEDVTQGAFVALARSAPQLTERAVLSGWLHRTAKNITAQTVRTDVRWLTEDPAVATLMGMEHVRGEDALPRLAKEMDAANLRDWMHRAQTQLYAALPEGFIADWDSTVNTRYGHQEEATVGYNPNKRGRKGCGRGCGQLRRSWKHKAVFFGDWPVKRRWIPWRGLAPPRPADLNCGF